MKIAEVRVSKAGMNIAAVLLSLVLCIAGVWLARMLPHYREGFAEREAVAALVGLIVLLVAHEAIHALGMRISGVPRRQIRFGVHWLALIPYCHCAVPVPLPAYRRMALLPLWVTGGITVIALLVYPTDGLGLLAGAAVAACVGDIWLVAKLRRFGNDLLAQDSLSDIGCDVLTSSRLSPAFPPTGGNPDSAA